MAIFNGIACKRMKPRGSCVCTRKNGHRFTICRRHLNFTMARPKRTFNFSRYKRRHIALKILYFGWDSDGLADQNNSTNTIEHHLFKALAKVCLIQSRETCNYNRCGRTDKGVSAYGQVVNLDVRSNLTDETDPKNIGLFTPENYEPQDNEQNAQTTLEELNYIDMLNRVLPDHVKAIAWAPVNEGFSARFNCEERSYSYLFPKGNLCIESMQKGASYLVGQHDFRNLCSMDLKNGVVNHVRQIVSASVNQVASNSRERKQTYDFGEVVIVGQAFLYHQIRCIMSILFLIGTKQEPPEIIRDLLNIELFNSKPNYNMASPIPLCLFECKYNNQDIPFGWVYNLQSLCHLLKQLKQLWAQYATKTLMIERAMFDIERSLQSKVSCDGVSTDTTPKKRKLDLDCWKDFGLDCDNMSDINYVPICDRKKDETLERKLFSLKLKKKMRHVLNDEGHGPN